LGVTGVAVVAVGVVSDWVVDGARWIAGGA
jgi:hypothetical protein